MSATLQALGRTLRQVGDLAGEQLGTAGMRQRALMLAGALALASAAPAHAQIFSSQPSAGQTITSSASAGYGQAQQGTVNSQGQIVSPGDAGTRTEGRVVGGILGFAASALTTKNPYGRVAATIAGAFVGGTIADNSIKNDQPRRQALEAQRIQQAQATNALTRYQYEGSGVAPVGSAPSAASVPGAVRNLPEPLRARLTTLVVDSAARRLVAQHQLAKMDEADVMSATAPNDLEARSAASQAHNQYQTNLNDLTVSLNDLNNALLVLASKGYEVRTFDAALHELMVKMSSNSPLQLDSPAVAAKVAEIEQAPTAIAQITSARDLQQVAHHASAAPKMR